MKKVILIFFLIVQFRAAYGQLNYEVAMSTSAIPFNWKFELTEGPTWKMINTITYDENKVKTYPEGTADSLSFKFFDTVLLYKFNVEKIPSSKRYLIKYFTAENTFFFKPMNTLKKEESIYSSSFKIRYLDSLYLILEPIETGYYDFEIGKVMTDEEFEKKQFDLEKQIDKNHFSIRAPIKTKSKKAPIIYWVFKRD